MASVRIYWCNFCSTYYCNSGGIKFTSLSKEDLEDKVNELERNKHRVEVVRDRLSRQCTNTTCTEISAEVGGGRTNNFGPVRKEIVDHNAWGS